MSDMLYVGTRGAGFTDACVRVDAHAAERFLETFKAVARCARVRHGRFDNLVPGGLYELAENRLISKLFCTMRDMESRP